MKKKLKRNDSLVVTYKDVDGVPIISKVYNISTLCFLFGMITENVSNGFTCQNVSLLRCQNDIFA